MGARFPIGFRRGRGDWQRDLPGLIGWARENGFASLDLAGGPDVADEAARVMAAGLTVGSVDLCDGHAFGAMLSADAGTRAGAVEAARRRVETCAAVGRAEFFRGDGAGKSRAAPAREFRVHAGKLRRAGADLGKRGRAGGRGRMAGAGLPVLHAGNVPRPVARIAGRGGGDQLRSVAPRAHGDRRVAFSARVRGPRLPCPRQGHDPGRCRHTLRIRTRATGDVCRRAALGRARVAVRDPRTRRGGLAGNATRARGRGLPGRGERGTRRRGFLRRGRRGEAWVGAGARIP